MDIRKVKKLIELLEESNIGEIEIKEGEESVRISRHGNQPAAPVAYAAPAPAPTPAEMVPEGDEAVAPWLRRVWMDKEAHLEQWENGQGIDATQLELPPLTLTHMLLPTLCFGAALALVAAGGVSAIGMLAHLVK